MTCRLITNHNDGNGNDKHAVGDVVEEHVNVASSSINAISSNKTIILFGDSLTELGYGGLNEEDDDNDSNADDNATSDAKDDNCNCSCTIGWVSLLSSTYVRRVEIINRGYRGYTTQMAVQLLPKIFPTKQMSSQSASSPQPPPPQQPPLFVTVWFGANDAVLPEEGKRHIPVEQYGDNLITIIKHIRVSYSDGSSGSGGDDRGTTSSPIIILLTPPPVDHIKYYEYCIKMYGNNDDSKARAKRSNEMVKKYVTKVKDVSYIMECDVIDVFTLLKGYETIETYTKYLNDGVHLTQQGQIKVYKSLMKLLSKKYPQLVPGAEPDNGGTTSLVPRIEKDWTEYF